MSPENQNKVNEAPYGQWQSPITPNLLTQGVKKLDNICVDKGAIYWTEQRPEEGGRTVIVAYTDESGVVDIIPHSPSQPYHVRSRVHEYGGAPYTVRDHIVYFVNDTDQRIYRYQVDSDEDPIPLTEPGIRYAHLIAAEKGLISVAEEHQEDGVKNFLAFTHYQTGKTNILHEGFDFYACPTLSDNEDKIAWIVWNHPDMPWDNTQLWVADFHQSKLRYAQKYLGNDFESIVEPKWSSEGELYCVSDRSGWWNIYRIANQAIESVTSINAEFTGPLWVHGRSTWDFISQNEIFAAFNQDGVWHICVTKTDEKQYETRVIPGTYFSNIHAGDGFVAFIRGGADLPLEVTRYDLESHEIKSLAQANQLSLDSGYISIPKMIEFPSNNLRVSKALLYLPQNKDYQGEPGTLPPLIVMSHGGPTANTEALFDLRTQYWTSRGFAVVDVNYGGSTGFGRDYRELLKGRWGIVDKDDCENAARYLIKAGVIDKNKLAIRGSSAGGYTTLCALTFGKVFTVGASYYGVSDLESLAKDTHKFESRYLDSLIGPYPERQDIYKERSPINFVEALKVPVIFFQGDEDKVVPLSQAESMANALKENGVTTSLIVYQGEQHGFRQAKHIQDAIMKECQFYLDQFYPPFNSKTVN